jgi:hypothetical protein
LSHSPPQGGTVTVQDGKTRRYREFYDGAAALEAAGLSE